MFADVERYNVSSVAFRVIFSVSLAIVDYQKKSKLAVSCSSETAEQISIIQYCFSRRCLLGQS